MMRRTLLAAGLFAAVVLPCSPLAAQHASVALPSTTPPAQASEFDFLVGDWTLAAVAPYPGLAGRIHGGPKMTGTWKAHRAFDGFGVEDELRLMDASGNPVLYASTTRVFDTEARRWTVSAVDVYRMRIAPGSAEWRDGKMTVTMPATTAGKTTVTRYRFFDITPASFTAWQDRSQDNGKSWEEGRLRITAKRAAARP